MRNTQPLASPPMSAPDLSQFFADLELDHLPHVSVNGVLFGAESGRLTVLLMRWLGMDVWGLPGGYVRRDEDPRDCHACRDAA